MKLINPALDDHMSPGLEGKRAGRLFQLGPGEGALDIPRSGVVALDQVREIVDLSRFHVAPSARLGHLAFESHGAFPVEG